MAVQQGRVNPITAYKDLVIEFQGNLLNQSTQVIKQNRGAVKPPNLETGDTRGQQQGNLVSEKPADETPEEAIMRGLQEKAQKRKLTDDEIVDSGLLDRILR